MSDAFELVTGRVLVIENTAWEIVVIDKKKQRITLQLVPEATWNKLVEAAKKEKKSLYLGEKK